MRGWARLRCQPDRHLDTLVTSAKLYHFATDRVLPAQMLMALQGFDPANLNFGELAYYPVAQLAGDLGGGDGTGLSFWFRQCPFEKSQAAAD